MSLVALSILFKNGLYTSINIARVIKSNRMRRMWHMEINTNAYKMFEGKPERKSPKFSHSIPYIKQMLIPSEHRWN
jgi:hypothetical protein